MVPPEPSSSLFPSTKLKNSLSSPLSQENFIPIAGTLGNLILHLTGREKRCRQCGSENGKSRSSFNVVLGTRDPEKIPLGFFRMVLENREMELFASDKKKLFTFLRQE